MNKIAIFLIFISSILATSVAFADNIFPNRTVLEVMPPDLRDNDTSCLSFRISGNDIGSDPWFSIPKNQNGYKEILALLLIARATKSPVNVFMSDKLVCGKHHAVNTVSF